MGTNETDSHTVQANNLCLPARKVNPQMGAWRPRGAPTQHCCGQAGNSSYMQGSPSPPTPGGRGAWTRTWSWPLPTSSLPPPHYCDDRVVFWELNKLVIAATGPVTFRTMDGPRAGQRPPNSSWNCSPLLSVGGNGTR